MKVYSEYRRDPVGLCIKQYAYYITSYKYNWHKDIELLIVLDGEIEVNKNGESHILSKDDIILINSNTGHATMARKAESVAMVIHFDPQYLSNWFKSYQNLHFKCISNHETKYADQFTELVKVAKEMALFTSLETEKDRLIYDALFHQLIGTLVRHFAPTIKKNQELSISGKNETVSQIVDYLEKYYQEKITLDDLVEVTGYNKSYISQIMKQALGINYYEYLTRIRIREAIFELTNTEEKISEIAYNSGFSDLKAFNTAFKDRFGKTPSQYRKMLVMKQKVRNSGERVYIDVDSYKSLLNEKDSLSALDICRPDIPSNDLYSSMELDIDCLEETLKETLMKVDNFKKQLSKNL